MTDQRTRLPSGATAREQASDWFAQRQAIADNPLLRQRFEQWRAAAPEHASAYAELENLWQSQAFEQALQALAVDLGLPPAPLEKPPVHRRWLATAAALLLMLGVGWIGDVQEDLPRRSGGPHNSREDAQCVVPSLNAPQEVHDGADGEAHHPRSLHDAQGAWLLPRTELQMQRAREDADKAKERGDVDEPRQEDCAVRSHAPAGSGRCRLGSRHVCP